MGTVLVSLLVGYVLGLTSCLYLFNGGVKNGR
jgi:hypothetical protein